MNCQDYLYRGCDPKEVTRRWFFEQCGVGLGRIALAGLVCRRLWPPRRQAPRPPAPPCSPSGLTSAGRAKAVIHLFMAGAPSHLDLFDHKPKLAEFEGKPIPPSMIGGQRYAFIRSDAAVLGPRFKFNRYGENGTEIAEILPHFGKIVDDVCLIRSMHTDQFNHAPAQLFINTGAAQPGRPSLGSWVVYGLGSRSERSAGIRRDVDRIGDQRRCGQLVERIFCPPSIAECGFATRGIRSSTSLALPE